MRTCCSCIAPPGPEEDIALGRNMDNPGIATGCLAILVLSLGEAYWERLSRAGNGSRLRLP